MGQNDSERGVACTLTDEEEAERPDEVLSVLTSRYMSYEERENSVDVRFDGTDESLRAIARFTANELQCCSFAEYDITVSPPYEETVLTVTGPNGTRQMFREGLVKQLEAEAA